MDDPASDRPWLRRPEWASGEIHSHARSGAFVALCVAVFWNAISWTCVIGGRNILFDKGILAGIWILIFPAVGVGLGIWAARALIRWRAFGESRFVISSLPGQIGGSLTGTIRTDCPLPPLRRAEVMLECVRRSTSGSGNSRSTTETMLWSDKADVNTDGAGAIPVAFFIPADCQESDDSDRLDVILWRLRVTAPGSLVSYRATFEVPVFKIAESSDQIARAERIREEHDRRIGEYHPAGHSRIRVRLAPNGSTEAYFPPMRAPFAALSLLGFLAVWTAIAVVIVVEEAPLLFRIVWPLTDVLLFAWLLALTGGSTTASARGDALTIAKHLFGLPISRSRIPSEAVAAIRTAPGMTAAGTVYSRIRVDLKDRRACYFGDGIADVNEAAWIALKLAQALSLSTSDSTTIKRSA